jgi:hypothetical protein
VKDKVGVWLDSAGALLVFLSDEEVVLRRIPSGVESRFRTSGGSRGRTPYGPQEVASESKAEERRKHQYHRYFQEVAQAIRRVDEILLLGPGEAKQHFASAIRKERALAGKLRKVETADRMTERQLVAKVRDFFLNPLAEST